MKRYITALILIILSVPMSADVLDDSVISGGEYGYGIRIKNNDTLLVDGGGADIIEMWDTSYLEVRSTSIPTDINWYTGGIRDIVLDDAAELLHLGGYSQVIRVSEDSTATIKGGYISAITSFQYASTKHVDLYCLPGWSWKTNLQDEIMGITGQWGDQSPFDIFLIDRTDRGYDPAWMNINVIEVPEPASLLLVGFGGLFLRRIR